MDYPLLRALAVEWSESLGGATVAEAYTQERDELTVALETASGGTCLRVRCAPARPLVWRADGGGRARRNSATVLPALAGRRVAGVRVADRDRFLYLHLDGGAALLVLPFGPRPNVLFLDASGVVSGAFLRESDWLGRPAPSPRPAPWPARPEALRERWRENGTSLDALARAYPTLGRVQAVEALARAGVPTAGPADADLPWERLVETAGEVEREAVESPRPGLYSRGRVPEAHGLVRPSTLPDGWSMETFGTADELARAWAVRHLAADRFVAAYRPIESALAAAARRLEESAAAMAAELQRPSRADRSERDAHLLMSQPDGRRSGIDRVEVPDILTGDPGATVEIPLDPALTIIENAERLYAKARQARGARASAHARHAHVAADAARAGALLAEVRALAAGGASARDLDAWSAAHEEDIARYRRAGAAVEDRLPYLRFDLPGGWEVRVGRSARDNVELTARFSSPHDIWLHARGVPGSHVVLRRPGRDAPPPRPVIEAAAGLAAWFSKARSQALVPVSYTERKYVRPVRGAAPGLVRLDREEVVMAEPRGT